MLKSNLGDRSSVIARNSMECRCDYGTTDITERDSRWKNISSFKALFFGKNQAWKSSIILRNIFSQSSVFIKIKFELTDIRKKDL